MKEDGNEITVCLIEWSWNKIILVCSTFKELLPQLRAYVQNIKLKIPNERLEIGFNILIENLSWFEQILIENLSVEVMGGLRSCAGRTS